MAFSWTSVTAGTTNITAAVMNEVKTNVDHLTTQLGVSAYSWSTLPVTQYNKANAVNITELQTSLTYVDNLNTCATHNATADSGANAGQDTAIHSGKDVSIHSGKDASIHTGKDATIHSGKDVTIHSGVQTTHYNDHNSVNNNPYNSGVLGTQYLSNLGSYWTTAQNGANGVVYLGNK